MNVMDHKDGKRYPCDIYCGIICHNNTNIPYCNLITSREYPCSCIPGPPNM